MTNILFFSHAGNDALEPTPTGTELATPRQISDANLDDDGTYLEPMISRPPSDEYDCVHNPNAQYMDLDTSSQQPASVYQDVTNPEDLKHSDTYLVLDPKSRSAETEYQALDPRGHASTYAII